MQFTVFFIVLSEFSVCFANWPKCQPGERCIPIQDCAPKTADQTGDQCGPGVGQKAVICGRNDTTLKVCCAAPAPPPSAQLPLQCGRQPVPHRGIRTNSVPPFGSHPWIGVYTIYRTPYFYPVIFISSTFVIDAIYYVPPPKIIYGASVYGVSEYGADQKQECVILRREEQCYLRREVGVKKRFKHPDSTTTIRLYKLNRSIDFNDRSALVEPICLPTKDRSPSLEEGEDALLVGVDLFSGQLRSTIVLVVNMEECKQRWKEAGNRKRNKTFWETKICARPTGPSVGGGGFWPTFLLVWDESEPPVFTLVGLKRWDLDGGLHLFHSVKDLLRWILKVTSGHYRRRGQHSGHG